MLSAKGQRNSPASVRKRAAFPRQNRTAKKTRTQLAFAYLAWIYASWVQVSLYTWWCIFVCFFHGSREGRGWTRTGFPREGFGVRRYSLFILQLCILGLSDDRVQIACALLLRRARSIRSLPQDAIARSLHC